MTKPTPPRTPSALKLHITQAEWEQLYKNGLIQAKVKGTAKELDPFPVVKLFYPAGSGTWLLSEIEPDELEIAWGLCRALDYVDETSQVPVFLCNGSRLALHN